MAPVNSVVRSIYKENKMKICKPLLISLILLSFLTASHSKETKGNKVEKTMDKQTNMMENLIFYWEAGTWNIEFQRAHFLEQIQVPVPERSKGR